MNQNEYHIHTCAFNRDNIFWCFDSTLDQGKTFRGKNVFFGACFR